MTVRAASRRGARAGLATRLFAAQTLVAVVGAVSLWLVAAALGPAIFRDHLRRVAGPGGGQLREHAEEAFRSASAVSVSLALLASLVAASAISAYVTHRLAAPVTRLAAAAGAVAAGRPAVRVPDPAIGAEFAALTAAFNAMAERLDAVETTRRRVLADLAHEVRTPVATLDAYLDGLEDGVRALDAETIAVLRGQTGRLTRLAADVAAVIRAEEGRLDLHCQPIAAGDLLAAAAAAAADRYAECGVTLTVAAEPGLPVLAADPERIGQVLANLLDNALRHTPPGGAVQAAAALADAPAGGGPQVVFAVADTGAGIAAEHVPHLFERFYRADTARDRRSGGSGIGLAIVKAIVEAHGGTVSATSPGPDRGATFTFTLPAGPQR